MILIRECVNLVAVFTVWETAMTSDFVLMQLDETRRAGPSTHTVTHSFIHSFIRSFTNWLTLGAVLLCMPMALCRSGAPGSDVTVNRIFSLQAVDWRRGVVVSGVRQWTKLTHVGPGSNWDGIPARLRAGIPSRAVTSELGQLSLASLPGRLIERLKYSSSVQVFLFLFLN